MAELSDQEMMRYNRQIILRGFDFEGQEALKDARVLVVGLGGLGCAATQYLAGAGVGHLTLLDFDTVSVSNLQRQTLHSDATVGQPKVISARDALTRINPYIAITPVNALLDDSEIHALIAEHDLVLDCTDNVSIRNQLNAGCFAARVPLVSGAAALMLEKNPALTNLEIKMKLKESARDMGLPKNLQGWGELDLERFMKL